ncbi:hypothetical protein DL98DRAFT_518736 [Cadophora sp. DSE1049]|nr:hypothetical protein DL98DRAFT_518736 [Cadophora sp. DSE1049]
MDGESPLSILPISSHIFSLQYATPQREKHFPFHQGHNTKKTQNPQPSTPQPIRLANHNLLQYPANQYSKLYVQPQNFPEPELPNAQLPIRQITNKEINKQTLTS